MSSKAEKKIILTEFLKAIERLSHIDIDEGMECEDPLQQVLKVCKYLGNEFDKFQRADQNTPRAGNPH